MSNGYGSSSGSGNRTGGQSNQRRTNQQGRVAPEGFHYMPDGTLMSDAEHNKLYGGSSEIGGRRGRLSDTSSDPCLQSKDFDLYTIQLSQFSTSQTDYHVWEICAFDQGTGGVTVVIPVGQYIGSFNYWGNPLAPYPYQQNTDVNFFYTWATQQVGPILVGDRIEVDFTMPQLPWSSSTGVVGTPAPGFCLTSFLPGVNPPGYNGTVGKVCLKYLGLQTFFSGQSPYQYGVPNTVATASLNTCDCKNFGIDPTIGPPEREPTYNCVKTKVMGQGTGGTPYTYNCEEVHYPLFGTYTSLLGTVVLQGQPGTPNVYANDGCVSNCGPQTNTDTKPIGGTLYTIK